MSIEVTHYRGIHQGGTKEYSIYLFFSTATKRAVLAKRWGKVGADGQIKSEICAGSGDTELNKAIKERSGKGYNMQLVNNAASGTFASVTEALDKFLSKSHQRSFYNNQLSILDPKAFNSTDRKSYDPMQDERNQMRQQMEDELKAQTARQAEIDRVQERDQLQSNPLFGMF